MSDTFAVSLTLAIVAGMVAWPLILDSWVLRAKRRRFQRLIAEVEAIDIDSFDPKRAAPKVRFVGKEVVRDAAKAEAYPER